MRIVVIGTGYVGLVTGACLSEMGHIVTCVDVDERKIENLKKGILPIYEPGLDTLVKENYENRRLFFSTSLKEAVKDSEVNFIAVGTPPGEDGSADLQYVLAVAKELGSHMTNSYSVVVNKSTVPVGTGEKVYNTIKNELGKRKSNIAFDVVSNPEFLKEGSAVDDFMHPDRVIIGANSEKAMGIMKAIYSSYTHKNNRILTMRMRDAEMTKYAANAMLATKISFINEIALICEKLDVDVENVRIGIGSDSRIGYHFIYPGCGYGGSCFPKDVNALLSIARENGVEPLVLDSVENRNARQKDRLFSKIADYFQGDLQGKVIALWGLSFKPGTDDMREAPSLVLIEKLIEAGATIQAFDPVSFDTAKREMDKSWFDNGWVKFAAHQYDAVINADALVLVTEWMPFRNPDFGWIKENIKRPVIFDGRNQYEPEYLQSIGFEYIGIGRGGEILTKA